MIYSIFPQVDTTIYESNVDKNTGIDSILELSHTSVTQNSTASCYNSRVILKFDVSGIEGDIQNGKISNANYYLALRTAQVTAIPQEYTVYAYPVSASWSNGMGRFSNTPKSTDGAGWKYRSSKQVGNQWSIPPAINEYEWDEMSSTWVDAIVLFGVNLSIYVTSSYCTNPGGGTWWDYDNIECTQSYSFQSSDLYMDVSPIVRKWITGSGRLSNDGMILKFDDQTEHMAQSFASLKFFSTDSNTIYVPRLNVVWDDSVFTTGSLTPIDLNNYNLNVKLKKYYSQDDKATIRVHANKKYIDKTYATGSYNTKLYYLPTSSYYEVRDAHTDEVILPFNTVGTKLSCDANGNYFNLWMNSFLPERFYRIAIKIESNGGDTSEIHDSSYYFKVTR